MSNILLLTPVYPSPDRIQKGTPVVHYFAKEWVKLGHNVLVCHYPANFPYLYRLAARPIKQFLESKLSDYLTIDYIHKDNYLYEGVRVYRIPLKKYIPHRRYSTRQVKKAVNTTLLACETEDFTPDLMIGHWVNPQIDIMSLLKVHFSVPTCLVLHGSGSDIAKLYRNKADDVVANINAFGFRSNTLKHTFEKTYGHVDKYFMCYSGVPKTFFDGIGENTRSFEKVRSFIFVGMLIQRKFPFETLLSLTNSEFTDFSLTYIGQGAEGKKINAYLPTLAELKPKSSVSLLGRIPREKIKQHLLSSDVFIMVSKNEVFGLVYLEAMATGCIPVAAKNEGFDGIIIDGVNGFLCEAGNVDELTQIINRIKKMPCEELKKISQQAIETANQMTDEKMAKNYLNDVLKLLL
jgi:glycosyltransferase involved in cell wall biosynthesis